MGRPAAMQRLPTASEAAISTSPRVTAKSRADRLATREGACDRLEKASVSGVTPEELKSVCLSFAGAREELPFDEANSVFKVAGKIFALSRLNDVPLRISLKCDPGLAIQLRTSYASITGGYHLTSGTGTPSCSMARCRISCYANVESSLSGSSLADPYPGGALPVLCGRPW